MNAGYLLDKATRRIHNLEHLTEQCNTDDILEGNKEHVGEIDLQALRFRGYDPCKHCMAQPV